MKKVLDKKKSEAFEIIKHDYAKRKLYPKEHKLRVPVEGTWKLRTSGQCNYCGGFMELGQVCYSKPIDYNEIEDVYTVQDVFCSLGCVKTAIIEENLGPSEDRLNWLTHMAVRVYGIRDPIIPAPHKTLFSHFPGGHIDWKKWRQNPVKCQTPPLCRRAPFVMEPIIIESAQARDVDMDNLDKAKQAVSKSKS